MRYNTGNPIDSDAPKDFSDNTKNLDQAINSTESTWSDRFGVERPTLPKLIDEFPNAFDDAARAEAARDEAEAAADGVSASAAAALASETNAATSEANAETAVTNAESAQSAAESARDAALLSRGLWQTTAQGIGQGVAGIASLVAGSGGTNGTFALAFSGGTQVIAPKGYFVVAGGVVIQVVITYAGHYSAGTPTLSFAASSGLIGASATAVMGANTPVDAYFSVPVAGSNDSLILYKVTAGPVASEITRYPSAAIADRISLLEENLADYTGSGDVVPVITDFEGKLLLGVDKVKGGMVVAGAYTNESADLKFGEYGFAEYIGDAPIYPIITDGKMQVVLGIEKATGNIVGTGFSNTLVTPATLQRTPLANAISRKAKNHILFYGQSLSVGAAAGSVLSTTQPYSNLTFNGGPRAWDGADWDFSAFKPLVEDAVSPAPDGSTTRKETACSGAANYASTLMAIDGTDPDDYVILASTAGHGGYRVDQLDKAAPWYTNFLAHVSGANSLDSDHAVNAVCWMQGENDLNITNYATYRARLEQLQIDAEADIKVITGQATPVYFISYQLSWGAADNPDITLAHLDLAQNNPRFFISTPTYHLPHAADNVHLTAIGYKWIGAYFGRAYKALADGFEPQWLNPKSATIRGVVVRMRFDVPVGPLVIDSTGLAATTDSGFRVLDGAGAATINSIQIDGSDVLITLSATPVGAVTVRYGLDYRGAGLTLTNGGSGNVRDSSPDVINISGTGYPLWNICPAFQLTAIALGE